MKMKMKMKMKKPLLKPWVAQKPYRVT